MPAKSSGKQAEVPIEIFEGPQGNVILKGLKEYKITSTKDLGLIYESAVAFSQRLKRNHSKNSLGKNQKQQ